MTELVQQSEYPGDIVRLSCEKCGRSGHYRKQKLIGRYGADMRLPDCGKRLQGDLRVLSNIPFGRSFDGPDLDQVWVDCAITGGTNGRAGTCADCASD